MFKKCIVCNKEFKTKPSHYDKRLCCSRECIALYYKEKFKGNKNPHWKGGKIKKICPICKKEFYVYICQKEKSKYCSYKCAGESYKKVHNTCVICGQKTIYKNKYCKMHNPRIKKEINRCIVCKKIISKNAKVCMEHVHIGYSKVIRLCLNCGKKMKVYKNGKRKYCSRKCCTTGKHNPNYKDGRKKLSSMIRDCSKNKKIIKNILVRDKYTCNNCGQIGGKLHVDHIKNFSDILSEFLIKNIHLNPTKEKEKNILFNKALNYKDFWDESNFQVLCKKCNLDKFFKMRKI